MKIAQVSRMLTASVLIVATAGCVSQTTIAALVTTLGNSAAALATIEGNTGLAAKLQTDVAAASAAVLAWKTGTPTQEVIGALNIVEDDLGLFPLGTKYQALVILSIGTIQSILALFPGAPAPPVAVGAYRLAHAPKNAAQFKAQWNALAPPALQQK